jgi:hypothetical protein
MKKIFSLVMLCYISICNINAQCIITPGCSAALGYCSTPAADTNLPNGTELLAYNETIQLILGTTFGIFAIQDASLTSIVGLPAGISYSLNPGAILNAGSFGCILLSGTPNAGSAGSYTVTANVLVNVVTLGAQAVTLSWFLVIDPTGTTSVKNMSYSSNFYISPNPATSEIFISSTSTLGKLQIIDALGKIILRKNEILDLKTTIDISNLNRGIYFIQIDSGRGIVSKKFIKD